MKLHNLFNKKNTYNQRVIKMLINTEIGCIASNRITKNNCKVGYMYREIPPLNNPDSGWRFLAGDEDEEYMLNTKNHQVHLLNTICNFDEEVIPLLDALPGSVFIRGNHGKLHLDLGENELNPPKMIDGANVLYYLTTNQVPILGYSIEMESGYNNFYAALVIAQYENSNEYYVFMCDSKFETINDNVFNTLEEAKNYRELDLSYEWIKVNTI